MIKTLYDETSLRPLDVNTLGRLEALENMLVKMAGVVGESLPSSKQALMGLATLSAQTVKQSQEDAAALWLHSLYPTEWKKALPKKKNWTLKEIKEESEEAITYINNELAKYLPLSGMATGVGNILFPVTLSAQAYLAVWPKAREVENDQQLVQLLVSQMAGGRKAGLNTPYLTDLLHPAGEGHKETVFFLPNGDHHWVAIIPTRATWEILTFPQGFDGVMIQHHQARLVDLTMLKGQLREIFVNSQPAKIRAMQRPVEDHDTKIQVLLHEIFDSQQAYELDHRTEHYHIRVVHGEHQQLKQMVAFVPLMPNGQSSGFELVAVPSAQKKFFIPMGDRLIPFEQAQLSPITKAILVDVLTHLEHDIKAAKRQQQPKKKTKAKAVAKKTVKKK